MVKLQVLFLLQRIGLPFRHKFCEENKMKKLTTLVLAAGLLVSSFAGSASAGEFKPVLQFAEEFTYGDAGAYGPENFNATSRIRFGFDYVASEDLSATILFQYRKGSWGHNGNDFTADPEAAMLDAGDHFRMRLAYIDWNIPGTDVKVRMGRHAVVAPSYAFGSAILDGRGDGITVSSAVNDNINVGFTWVRAYSEYANSDKLDAWEANNDYYAPLGDDADLVMLNAEFAYDGFKVAPWVMYAHFDNDAIDPTGWRGNVPTKSNLDIDPSSDSFVIGVSAELNMFDPFVFAVDALYSNTKYHNANAFSTPFLEDSYDGFYIAAKGSYKFDNGTASLGAWYASGTDYYEEDSPLYRNDKAFMLLDGGFSASTILFDGNIIGSDGFTNISNGGADSPFGTWGIIAEYANFSFLENLSHTARVLYVKGTNENETAKVGNLYRDASNLLVGTLTEDDSVIEIDFDTTYQIYKNLSATLQLGYAIFDQSKLDPFDLTAKEQDDVFRSALTFVYKF